MEDHNDKVADPEGNGVGPDTLEKGRGLSLIQMERELLETRKQYRLALEDFERGKKRLERESEREIERNKREFLASLLEVVDDLDRAIVASVGQVGRGEVGISTILEGVDLVRSRFLDQLAKHGVTRVDPKAEHFDPELHEAISVIPLTDPRAHNLVLEVIRPGYLIGGETLRPAGVVVGKVRS